MILINGHFYHPEYLINIDYFAVIAAIIFVVWATFKLRRQQKSWLQVGVLGLFVVYLLNVLNLTIFPIAYFTNRDFVATVGYGQQIWYNFTPKMEWLQDKQQLILNVLMFVPLGVFLPFILSKGRSWFRIIVILFSASFGIELIQAMMSYFYLGHRFFDPIDILTNVVGGIIGYGIFSSLNTFAIFRKTFLKLQND